MYLVPIASLPSIQSKDPAQQQVQNPSAGEQSFASIMQEAMDTLAQTQEAARLDSYNLAMGDVGSLHSLMINSALEATAVETAVQLTSRAVGAYKEIMQMQI